MSHLSARLSIRFGSGPAADASDSSRGSTSGLLRPPNSARVAFTVARLKEEDYHLTWQPPVFTHDVDRLEVGGWRVTGDSLEVDFLGFSE